MAKSPYFGTGYFGSSFFGASTSGGGGDLFATVSAAALIAGTLHGAASLSGQLSGAAFAEGTPSTSAGLAAVISAGASCTATATAVLVPGSGGGGGVVWVDYRKPTLLPRKIWGRAHARATVAGHASAGLPAASVTRGRSTVLATASAAAGASGLCSARASVGPVVAAGGKSALARMAGQSAVTATATGRYVIVGNGGRFDLSEDEMVLIFALAA